MSEKITYGIKNVYYAKLTTSASGIVTFGTPTAFPGAKEISLPPVGDPVKVYADNIVYAKFHVNQGYDGNLSVYNVPEDFAKEHLGMSVDENGVLVEDASGTQSDFALLFEFNTDTTDTKRVVLYNCSAGRPNVNGKTKEQSVDPELFSIPISAAPATDTEYVKASIVGSSSDSTWNSWFSSVYTPSTETQYLVTVTVDDGVDEIADALVVCGGKIGMTDSNGEVTFMLPNGTYDILVSADGYIADTDSVTVVSAAATKTVTMTGA